MVRLDEARAFEQLFSMVQASTEPTLTATELDMLLDLARRADPDGLAPSDGDWDPSWDLNAAAAEGWRWKAGKVVPRFNVTVDGSTLHRAQLYAHCAAQADHFARRIAIPVPLKAI